MFRTRVAAYVLVGKKRMSRVGKTVVPMEKAIDKKGFGVAGLMAYAFGIK